MEYWLHAYAADSFFGTEADRLGWDPFRLSFAYGFVVEGEAPSNADLLDLTVEAARSATGLRQVTTYAGQPYWLDLEFGTPSIRPGSIQLTLPIAWLGVYVLPQLPGLSHVAVGGGAVSLAAWAADKALGGALGQVGKDLVQRIYEGVQRLRGVPEMPKERREAAVREPESTAADTASLASAAPTDLVSAHTDGQSHQQQPGRADARGTDQRRATVAFVQELAFSG